MAPPVSLLVTRSPPTMMNRWICPSAGGVQLMMVGVAFSSVYPLIPVVARSARPV